MSNNEALFHQKARRSSRRGVSLDDSTNTPDPVYFTVWPCVHSTRLLVLVSVESVHLPFLEVQFGYQLIPNLQKRQMDRLYGD